MIVKVTAAVLGTEWKALTALSCINLTSYFAMNRIPGAKAQELSFVSSRGSILPQLRTHAVKLALDNKSTHILFIDSDQTFPPDTLHRFLAHKLPCVGANSPTKTFPSYPTARNFDPEIPVGQPVYTFEKSTGLERVWRIGTGVLLLETRLFTHVISEPWFNFDWREKGGFIGEDWFMSEKLEKAGIWTYIDHDVSQSVGHVGDVEYTHAMCIGQLELHMQQLEAGDEHALDEESSKISAERQSVALERRSDGQDEVRTARRSVAGPCNEGQFRVKEKIATTEGEYLL